jgi:phosphate transport system permease protein
MVDQPNRKGQGYLNLARYTVTYSKYHIKNNIMQTNITPLYRSRQRSNLFGLVLSMSAMALGLIALVWILFVLFSNGFAALELSLFTQDTPAPGSEGGGLRNAIVGSLMIVGLAVLVSTPIGVLAGVYLTEYGDNSKTAEFTRFVTDIMLSAPSIVLGLFVYAIAVRTVGHFSGYAGSLALSLIAIPVVMRTTENMLRLVPGSLREAAFALGAPRWKVATMVSLRAARSGVMTGLLLAIARISGETAPLLFTALNNQFFSTNMESPIANLPVVIFQFAMSPYDNWINLAWGGALLITLTVLALNILARVFFRNKVRT